MILKHIRPIILTFSGALAVVIFFYIKTTYAENLQVIRIVQFYSLTSLTYLYITLLASPLYIALPQLPGKIIWIKGRRALGLSAFAFGLLHAYFAFFKSLGGLDGLPFLGQNYMIPILFGLTALIILTLMAITSNNKMTLVLGKNWKRLHRLIYVAAISIIIHALKLGTHFTDLSQTIPTIFIIAFVILALLELYRFDHFIQQKFQNTPKFLIFTMGTITLTVLYFFYAPPYLNGDKTFSIHGHKKENQQSSQHTTTQNTTNTIDKFKVTPKNTNGILPQTDVEIPFQIVDTTTEKPISLFKIQYEKPMHTVIVDSSLTYYDHIHPEQSDNQFIIKTNFPSSGTYHVYLNYLPFGETEQIDSFTITVGGVTEVKPSIHEPDSNFTKTVDTYNITLLNSDKKFSANLLSTKQQSLALKIVDKQTNQSITDLQTYLGAYGHLVMIHQQSKKYTHVHPIADQESGPFIEFMPLEINNKPLEKGIYRMFAQFKHKDKINLVDFTINVE